MRQLLDGLVVNGFIVKVPVLSEFDELLYGVMIGDDLWEWYS